MKFLFFFLDGIGLGPDDPHSNPIAATDMPTLQELLNGHKLVEGVPPLDCDRATLLALDACMGVEGRPQSASGQAALLTGINVPAELGYHYGPKPNKEIAKTIKNGNLFSHIKSKGLRADLLNSFPPRYFEGLNSGRRLAGAIAQAVLDSGGQLRTKDDLFNGRALSADFTGLGWREHLGYPQTPVISPYEAGHRIAKLAEELDFAMFEYWPSDFAGHHQDMTAARQLLIDFDQVLAGILSHWDMENGLLLITSDHGNMEDITTRRHTMNDVPAVIIANPKIRHPFTQGLSQLSDIAPNILALYP